MAGEEQEIPAAPPADLSVPEASSGSPTEGQPDTAAPSPVAAAIEKAEARLKAGGSLTEGPDAQETPKGEAPATPEGADPEGEDEDGEPVATGEVEDLEGEPDGEGDEDGGEAPDDGKDEPEEEFVTVTLPGRRPNETKEVAVSKSLAEDLNRLRRGYLRGEQARARENKVQQQIAENAIIDQQIEVDPAGFVLERVHPSTRKELLLALLTDETLAADDAVRALLDEWEGDPELRRKAARDLAARRKQTVQQRTAETAATKEVARIAAHVSNLGQNLDDDRGEVFYRTALGMVQAEAKRRGTVKLSDEEVTNLLKHHGLLSAYGITVAAGKGSKPGSKVSSKVVTPEEARATGQQLKDQSARRRSAAAVAPAGAGAPSSATTLPKGQTIEERIETVRKKGLASFAS